MLSRIGKVYVGYRARCPSSQLLQHAKPALARAADGLVLLWVCQLAGQSLGGSPEGFGASQGATLGWYVLAAGYLTVTAVQWPGCGADVTRCRLCAMGSLVCGLTAGLSCDTEMPLPLIVSSDWALLALTFGWCAVARRHTELSSNDARTEGMT